SVLPPNLLIPVNQATPASVYGPQYTGEVLASSDNTINTFVSFDVPPLADSASHCYLEWTAPSSGSFPSVLTGTKKVDYYAVTSEVSKDTLSWNTKPTRGKYLGTWDAETGVFSHSTVTCEFGKVQQFELAAHGEAEVEWFQEWNPLTGLNYVMV
ncbi:ubiquitin 3 binding protein But2, partial [Dipodascopsis tothii]|uniref:ubiquitin 3 binding protein But2 n=1 Tax=Dipodascopsis tothii TaxID=44089 RepID=UPI0034CFDBC3